MVERCPICGKGALRTGHVQEAMFGISLGSYEGEVCDNCGESFLGAKAMDVLETKAKELGLWGLGTKVKVTQVRQFIGGPHPSPSGPLPRDQEWSGSHGRAGATEAIGP